MAINLISKNLVALRKNHNLTTAQAAVIAEVDKAVYEKMELGFEEVSYEVMTKLANFYNVDVLYFTEKHGEESAPEKVEEAAPVVVKEEKQEKTSKVATVGTKLGKIFRIIGLVSAILVLIAFAACPVYTEPGYSIFIWDLVNGFITNELAISASIVMIYAIVALVFSIIQMSVKKAFYGKFGLISSIISIALGSIAMICEFVILSFANFLFSLTAVLILATLTDVSVSTLKMVAWILANKKAKTNKKA